MDNMRLIENSQRKLEHINYVVIRPQYALDCFIRSEIHNTSVLKEFRSLEMGKSSYHQRLYIPSRVEEYQP